jgi:DNA (cytosine-5)-methyltransferase 1
MAALGTKPIRPSGMIELGDPELLELDMRSAASYWDIPIPIGRRDRRSGLTKRRQWEIEAAMQHDLAGA